MSYKFLLVALNAKFIHSNPAVYSLRAYAGEKYESHIQIAEYTINHSLQTVLSEIYGEKPDAIGISCYIWNSRMVADLLPELRKLLPDVSIWLGGPEVSYASEEILRKHPEVTGIMVGEGEETFLKLLQHYLGEGVALEHICGIVYRRENSFGKTPAGAVGIVDTVGTNGTNGTEEIKRPEEICINAPGQLTEMDRLPFLYHDLTPFKNRIVYYETSRGCPYKCSYCLSSIERSTERSIEKRVRFRSLSVVKKELQYFLDQKLPQVKFVDRTFNCNHEHAMEIWRYLIEHDNGVTNFHFEMEAELINDEEFALLKMARPGLFQMEIGVQTTCGETLKEINRTSKIEKIRAAVKRLKEAHNIHIHLDLIAGLPFEDYSRFGKSFDEVYAMEPEQLQLGFLKVLKGTDMLKNADVYGLRYLSSAPYEVLSTKWLSFSDIVCLKKIEEMVELYYNSNQFTHVMPLLENFFDSPFAMYERLSEFYEEKGFFKEAPARSYRYSVLLAFIEEVVPAGHLSYFKEALTYDVYLRENAKSRPEFAKDLQQTKVQAQEFYQREAQERRYLPDYAGCDARALRRMTHLEYFCYPVWDNIRMRELQKDLSLQDKSESAILFDYKTRDPLTYCARTVHI